MPMAWKMCNITTRSTIPALKMTYHQWHLDINIGTSICKWNCWELYAKQVSLTNARVGPSCPQAPVYRDRTKVTSHFHLHTFRYCKLTVSIFIPTLFWPHPIVYPLTDSRRLYFLGVKVKLTMGTSRKCKALCTKSLCRKAAFTVTWTRLCLCLICSN